MIQCACCKYKIQNDQLKCPNCGFVFPRYSGAKSSYEKMLVEIGEEYRRANNIAVWKETVKVTSKIETSKTQNQDNLQTIVKNRNNAEAENKKKDKIELSKKKNEKSKPANSVKTDNGEKRDREKKVTSEKDSLISSTKNCYEEFTFGCYQNEPIIWYILENSGSEMLLLSKYGIDCQQYDGSHEVRIDWKDCSLRKWLNKDFFNEAFSKEERSRIVASKVYNRKHLDITYYGEWDKRGLVEKDDQSSIHYTLDNVFVFDIIEAKRYFPNDRDRLCQPTKVTKAKGVSMNNVTSCCPWWLRSSGSSFNNATVSGATGAIDEKGWEVNKKVIAIRPCIRISRYLSYTNKAILTSTHNSVLSDKQIKETDLHHSDFQIETKNISSKNFDNQKKEYDEKRQHIEKLVEEGKYSEAVILADTIDWNRVQNLKTLCLVSDLFEHEERYEDSKKILMKAYIKYPDNKILLHRIVVILIKLGQYEQAKVYFNKYEKMMPDDSSTYLLKYELDRNTGLPLIIQIESLKNYLLKEYDEKYALDLMQLYFKEGRFSECVVLCNEILFRTKNAKTIIMVKELKARCLQSSLTNNTELSYSIIQTLCSKIKYDLAFSMDESLPLESGLRIDQLMDFFKYKIREGRLNPSEVWAAVNNIAICSYYGWNIKPYNDLSILHSFVKLSEEGNDTATFNVGVACICGIALSKSILSGALLIKQAALSGNKAATSIVYSCGYTIERLSMNDDYSWYLSLIAYINKYDPEIRENVIIKYAPAILKETLSFDTMLPSLLKLNDTHLDGVVGLDDIFDCLMFAGLNRKLSTAVSIYGYVRASILYIQYQHEMPIKNAIWYYTNRIEKLFSETEVLGSLRNGDSAEWDIVYKALQQLHQLTLANNYENERHVVEKCCAFIKQNISIV